jgi:hypothetical protein
MLTSPPGPGKRSEWIVKMLCDVVWVGLGATMLVDLWALLRRALFRIALPDYGLVGRWFAHMARGHFRHARIADAAAVRGERVIGWSAHYLIGIAFAGALLLWQGAAWMDHPMPGPALIVGIGGVLAPYLLMQPGMGLGVFALRAPRPNAVRLQSLVTHAVFGLGLYATAWINTVLRAH